MKIIPLDKHRLPAGEVERICNLFNSVYPDMSFSKAYVNWKFFDTPFDINFNIVAYNGTEIVGHAALVPRKLLLDGVELRAGQSLGSAVHPEYQRKDMYISMAKMLYENALEKGIRFIWGFPNINSHYGRKTKLGWQDIYEIPMKQLDLRKRPNRISPKYAEEVAEVKIMELDFKSVYAKMDLNKGARFVRNKEYFLWRYDKNPRYRYITYAVGHPGDVNGYILIKHFQNTEGEWIDIIDFAAVNGQVFEILVEKVIMRGIEDENVIGINTWINPNHEFAPLLERFGFINTTPITYFSFYRTNWEDASEQYARLSDFRNWHLTLGDSDVY